ncbi:Inorganic diphosphatase [Bertholletia excelsa]
MSTDMNVNTRNSPKSIPSIHQESYVRARDNPFFDGMRRGDAALMDRPSAVDFQEKITGKNISHSASYISDRSSRKVVEDMYEEITYSPSKDSPADIVLEPDGQSFSERWSRISKSTLLPSPNLLSDLSIDCEEEKGFMKESSLTVWEGTQEYHSLTDRATQVAEKSYRVSKRRTNFSGIPLPSSASSFYSGYSPQIEILEWCESINWLNLYLQARRDDVNAGVPGKFLHAVIGQDVADVGSVASTIMYAFYLNETARSSHLCIVPVINMKRADLDSHAELKWLLDSCFIDQSSLIFVDEIDLSYYDLFGSLKLVLLNGNKLPAKQEVLKEALVEIFNCRKGDPVYSWVQTITVGQDCSCCTLIAEKFTLASPEILRGQALSRLLLAGILLDTGNLSNPQCTSKDKYMATLLINGAGRFGCNGLYQILKYKMHDVYNHKLRDILRKDFKKWTRVGKPDSTGARLMVSHIGMSSIGISIEQLLAQDDTSVQEVTHFQQLEKLRLLMVVSGYYDSQKNFKREILVSAESVELMKSLLNFFRANASQLPLKAQNLPGIKDGMRAFEVDKVTSRKTIEKLLEEFDVTPNSNTQVPPVVTIRSLLEGYSPAPVAPKF